MRDRGPGAAERAQYAATFTLSDGRRQLVVGRRRLACVGQVSAAARGRVEVRGVSARGTRGAAVRATVRKKR